MVFTLSARRRSGVTLYIACCFGLLSAFPVFAVQVQFPSKPTDPDQCRPPAAVAIRALQDERHQRMTESHARGREWMRQCEQRYQTAGQTVACYKQGDHIGQQYNNYVRQQEANVRQVEAARRQCEEVARENQQIIGRQREQEAQMRRQQEHQHQQAQQAERAQAAARSEAMRAQQQADLERARQQAERNQPRVIGQVPGGYYDPATRNDPRAVQTPQQQAQARIDAEQNARAQRARDAQTMRDVVADVATALVTGDRSRAGNAALERTLNPGGTRDATIDSRVERARQENADMNERRGITPLATEFADASLTGIGASHNNTVGNFAGATDQMASLSNTAPAGSGGQSQGDAESVYWDSIKNSTNVHDFRTYLSRYPRGRFRIPAEGRITALTTGSAAQATPQQQSTPTTDTRSRWYRD